MPTVVGVQTSKLGLSVTVMRKDSKYIKSRRRVELYLNLEDYQMFLAKKSSYRSMSAMIRDAVRLFDDEAAIKKVNAQHELKQLINSTEAEWNRIGNNLNQLAHQANILALNDEINTVFFQNTVIPQLEMYTSYFIQYKKTQEKIWREVIKRNKII